MNKLIIIVMLMASFLVLGVAGVPPFSDDEIFSDNVEIIFPGFDYYPYGHDITIHFHAHNGSNGVILTNLTTECELHLYNNSGNHIVTADMWFDASDNDFELVIGAGNFSDDTNYQAVAYCNHSKPRGGSARFGFVINTELRSDIPTDNTSGLAITVFILFAVIGLFVIPLVIEKLSDNHILNLIFKRSMWVLGLALMALNSAIMATIAAEANLPLTKEMFRYMWLFGWAMYCFMAFLVLKTFFDVLRLWYDDKEQKRMGGGDDLG